MNLSKPILICDENEEIRLLLKEMLTKHGYFHLVEANSPSEIMQLVSGDQFVLIHKTLLNEDLKRYLSQRENYLVVAQNDDSDTVNLAAYFGVNHFISFPYTSKTLVEKINSLMS